MKNFNMVVRNITFVAVCSALVVGGSFQLSQAAPGGAIEPDVPTGITILPLEQHPVPDLLRTQARLEFTQMKERGYVDATEDAVSFLDKAKEDKDKRLKTMVEVAPKLKVSPADMRASPLGQATLLGATESGGYTEEGWTGLDRLFVVPKFGLVGLNEVDYVASQGGIAFIKEAINQDVNGYPAILSVKQSRGNKGLTELTWATDRKIYSLSTNRALKNKQSIDSFMELARSIY